MMNFCVRLLVILGLGGLALCAQAKPQEGYIDGVVNVQSRQLVVVSNEYGNSFFPGQKLSIDVAGTIDVNPYEQWEEDCFLGICKRRTWIVHQWFDAAKLPVAFRLVDENDQKVAEFVSHLGKAEFSIPTNVSPSAFNRRLRLLGMIVDTVPPIDGRRSRGQYTVRIHVNTADRIRHLPKYLSDAKPTAAELKQRWVHDPFLIEQNRAAVVRGLINLAQTAYPPTDTTKADDHRALLDYAAELDPTNVGVGIATADMFIKQGNFQAAETQIVGTIKNLRKLPGSANDPATQSALARAYIALASTMTEGRGYADAKDLSAIVAHYTSAIDIATRFRAPLVQAEALFNRALALRSRNTLDALKAARLDLKAARDRSPHSSAGLPSFVAPGAEEMLINESPGKLALATWSLGETVPNKRLVDLGGSFARAWTVTTNGKAYVSDEENLGVVRLDEPNPAFEPLLPNVPDMVAMQSNGTYSILTRVAQPAQTGYVSSVMSPPVVFEMLREAPGGLPDIIPITIDGKPVRHAILAREVNRYLAVGAMEMLALGKSVVPFELREITSTGEIVLRRFTVEGMSPDSLKISPDGQQIVGIVHTLNPGTTSLTQKVIVLDASGSTTEVLAVPVPAWQPNASTPLPGRELVSGMDFMPGSQNLLIVRMDGLMQTLPVAANPVLTRVARNALNQTGPPVHISRTVPVGTNYLVIEGKDVVGLFVQVFNTTTRELKMVRVKDGNPLPSLIGYWHDGPQGVNVMQLQAAPTTLRSVRTSDNSTIGSARFEFPDMRDATLLAGGRLVCTSGQEAGLMELDTGTYTAMPAPPTRNEQTDASATSKSTSSARSPSIQTTHCVPQRARDGWVLLRLDGNTITSATTYVGTKAQSVQNALPPVPADIIQMETAAAARLKQPYVVPAFTLSQADQINFATADGRMFTAAYPYAAANEAHSKPTVQWASIPYIFLQDAELTVQRMRLPLGATALKILPLPHDKVIYLFKGKVWWKPLHTDTDGKFLVDLPLLPITFLNGQVTINQDQMRLAQIAVNRDATRMIFGLHGQYSWGKKDEIEIEQKVFDITSSDIKPIPCAPCAKRKVQAATLQPLSNVFPLAWGVVQTDERFDRLVLYKNNEQAAVFDLAAQRQIASLPFKNIVWFNARLALYLSGPNEYSVINY